MLWVTADPGCGKSVLASSLVDFHHQKTGNEAIVLSYFFKAGESTRQKSQQALCAIFHGLLSYDQSLLQKIAADDFSNRDPTSFTSSIDKLWQNLIAAASCVNKQVICIIDALDECGDKSSRDQLCHRLASSFRPKTSSIDPTNMPSNLKFLVTSRPWPDIEATFRSIPSIRLRGEDEAECLTHDIGLMVQHKVNELVRTSAISAITGENLKGKLLRGADNTFLWASLVLDQVAVMPSRRMSAIEEMVNRLPSDLEHLYKSALADLQSTSESISLLEMLLVAKRPLSVNEVTISLSIVHHTTTLENLQRDLEPNPEWTIKKLGGFFVRLSNSKVLLVHETAREFLLAKGQRSSINLQRAQSRLAASCIHFLSLQGLPPRHGGIPGNAKEWSASNADYLGVLPAWCSSFFQYSASSWFLHFEDEALSPGSDLHICAKKLCDTTRASFATWWPFILDPWRSPATHFAHFAAKRQYTAIVRGLVETGYCAISDENEDDFSLLAVAAGTKNIGLVKWMLGRTEQNTAVVGGALLVSMWHGQEKVAMVLAETGIDMNRPYKSGRHECQLISQLLVCAAAGFRLQKLLRILCDHGLVVEDTHVLEAATKGLDDILEVLLLHDRRSLDDRLPGLQQALHAATIGGWPNCRALLLKSSQGGLQAVSSPELEIGLRLAAQRLDADAVDQLLQVGVHDSNAEGLLGACENTADSLLQELLATQTYSQAQLDRGLLAYFDMASGGGLRGYQTGKLATALGPDACRGRKANPQGTTPVLAVRPVFQVFPWTGLFGTGAPERAAVLDMLLAKGAKVSPEKFVGLVAEVIPMDEDFAIFLLDRIQLQTDPNLRMSDFLTLACFWGKAALVQKALAQTSSAQKAAEAGFELPPYVEPSQRGQLLLAATISGNPRVVELLLQKHEASRGISTACWDEEALSRTDSLPEKEMPALWSIVKSALPDFANGPVRLADLARALGYRDIECLLNETEAQEVSPRKG